MELSKQLQLIHQQIYDAPSDYRDPDRTEWFEKSATILRLLLGPDNDNYQRFKEVAWSLPFSSTEEHSREDFESGMTKALSFLEAAKIELEVLDKMKPSPEGERAGPGNEIFIVHGHNEAFTLKVRQFVHTVTGREPIILAEQPNLGLTLFEKFERDAAKAGFAVVLATADDLGHAKTTGQENERARQNVILEWGFFAGRLGRNRVALLHEGSVELPSDIGGLVYTKLDTDGAWRFDLAKDMKAAGISVSLDKLL